MTRKPKGGQVLSVRVELLKGRTEEVFVESNIFDRVSTNLLNHFQLAFTALSYSGPLFDDIGFLGDTE